MTHNPSLRKPVVCTCGHIRSMHNEHASVARHNGPTSKRACELCDCWTWKPVVEARVT